MAMYHFRLKSDKKPDGTRISGVEHVDYIRREGNYAEEKEWGEKNKFAGDLITSAEVKNACKDLKTLLYKTDNFGGIRNTEEGIELTEKASMTTIAVALMLADKTMNHKPLIISGSNEFLRKVVDTAIFDNLPIKFADKRMQNEVERQREINDVERREFIAGGGKILTESPNIQPVDENVKPRKLIEVVKEGINVPTLSQLKKINFASEENETMLSDEEILKLNELAKKSNEKVRWDFSEKFKNLAKETAQEIMKNIEEKLENVYAESHVEYINREKAYERKGGCIFHSHHLPKWAKEDPKKFFKMADKYEGVGNRRYVEIEFALPNELKTVEEYREIIDAFIEKHLKSHYYTYAIHEKIGMMSEEQRHPHVHIMFSERLIDEVEKIKERPAKNYFKYPARKKRDGSEPSFEEKYKRGSARDRKWCSREYVCKMREDLARIENEVLAKNGFSIRVDHRTLKAQKEEAEQKGDSSLARLFNRMPEQYVGIIACKENADPKVERLKKFRELRNQHFDLVFKNDAVEKEIEELETKDAVQKVLMKAREYITSEEYLSQKFDTPKLNYLKEKVEREIKAVNDWKRQIITKHEAEEKAKFEYMTPKEREIWNQYFEMKAQKKNMEEFLEKCTAPETLSEEAAVGYEEVRRGAKNKMFLLLSSAALLKKSIWEIQQKLETPDCKKNIQLVTHQILQKNKIVLEMLKSESEELDRAVDELKDAIFYQSVSDKDYYKTREIYDILCHQYFVLKKEHEKNLELKYTYKRKVISPLRALEMAKNIFAKGEWKNLRASLRKLQKDSEKLAKKLADYNERENIFKNTKSTPENQAELWQEKYSLTRERMLIGIKRKKLDALKISLDDKKKELEELCSKPESVRQIQIIATGILRKNRKFVEKFEEQNKKVQGIAENIQRTKAQIDIVELQLKSERRTTYYQVLAPKYSDKTAAVLIADAMLREPHAAQLVARSTGKNLEMEKTWELMSEIEKDELLHQKVFRDL